MAKLKYKTPFAVSRLYDIVFKKALAAQSLIICAFFEMTSLWEAIKELDFEIRLRNVSYSLCLDTPPFFCT